MIVGQIAYKANTGELVEAFSLTEVEWEALSSSSKGTLRMPRSDWPAIPKTSIRGLRFFAHHPGYPGKLPKPESYAHTRLKIDTVKAARALGYQANVEVAGSAPDGTQWIADTLITHSNGKRIAFEVQLSSQHLRDFRLRTEKYRQSSVECCWIVAEKPVGSRLSKALAADNIEYYRAHGEFQADAEDLLLFGVQLANKDAYPEKPPPLRFGRGPEMRRMPILEAIDGVIKGLTYWRQPVWHWDDRLDTSKVVK
jgi:hypothetical protein